MKPIIPEKGSAHCDPRDRSFLVVIRKPDEQYHCFIFLEIYSHDGYLIIEKSCFYKDFKGYCLQYYSKL